MVLTLQTSSTDGGFCEAIQCEVTGILEDFSLFKRSFIHTTPEEAAHNDFNGNRRRKENNK
jgi:hypothetical protein